MEDENKLYSKDEVANSSRAFPTNYTLDILVFYQV